MKKWTMREVYEELGVSRTTLQGWVDDILGGPTGADENGWYFNEKDFERLWRIRIYKQLKYKNIEIRNALLHVKHFDKNSLQAQIEMLTQQKEELEQLITIATIMKDTGTTPSTIRFGIAGMEDAPFQLISKLMSSFGSNAEIEDREISGYDQLFDDKNTELLNEAINNISDLRDAGKPPEASEIQTEVARLHDHFAIICCPSVFQFTAFTASFYPDTLAGRQLDEIFGSHFATFFTSAVKAFAAQNTDNPLDNAFKNAYETIVTLARKKYTTGSPEVQEQVYRIHEYLRDIGLVSVRLQLLKLRQISALFASDFIRKKLDGSTKRGIAWFLSRSIEIYCNGLDHAEMEEINQHEQGEE